MIPTRRIFSTIVVLYCILHETAIINSPISTSFTSEPFTISSIVVQGAISLPEQAILDKFSFKKGQIYFPDKTNKIIADLYKMGLFQQIKIIPEKKEDGSLQLTIIIIEKPKMQDLFFEGNKHVSQKDIQKKYDLTHLKAATQDDMNHLCRIIEMIYKEKGYLFAKATAQLKKTPDNDSVTGLVTVDEGIKSIIKKVRFVSDSDKPLHFHSKKLRSFLFTKEDWLFGALDHSGSFHPQMLEVDKYTLENFYQSHGFLHAKVVNSAMTLFDKNRSIEVTFTIHEGDQYTVSSVSAPGNDLCTEKQLLLVIPLKPGMIYSKELVRVGIERLKTVWGDQGYIYADIDPSIQPDEDNKTVALTFYSDINNKVKLNRIAIHGNTKTRDKIIRRRLLLEEQNILTTSHLEHSKQLINGLGYFDPKDGVNYKINRITDDMADLDILVKEIKTGRGEMKLTYGGAPNSFGPSNTGIAGEISLMERNMFGKGIILQTSARLGAENQTFEGGFTQPWLFDRPIRFGCDALYNHSQYDTVRKVVNTIEEKQAGFSFNGGFASAKWYNTAFIFQAGFNLIELYSSALDGMTKVKPQASDMGGYVELKNEFQMILDDQLKSGKYLYLESEITQDTRNHTTHISQGYKWDVRTKIGIPSFKETFGFIKCSFNGHWYTPLIDEHTLVLHLHGYAGIVGALGNNAIPYRELYHIGGPSNVRGWEFGQISPLWYAVEQVEDEGWQGNSIGAKKAFFVNAELVFPIRDDLSIKGVLFYDGGSGWDTPHSATINSDHLKNNSFDFRHCIGFGVRLLQPQPMRVDWAFKLDRRTGETASEVSFSSYYDF